MLNIPTKITNAMEEQKINQYTDSIEEAYQNDDWDALYDILIIDVEHSIASPYYFTYRSAWLVHEYAPLFDEAAQNNDTKQLLSAYEHIASDYDMRQDESFYRIYETIPSIEKSLKEEYERETQIMIERGFENEMYQLRQNII